MNSEQLQLMRKWLSSPQSIVIVPHKNPDGDAIGSCLGLYHFLRVEGFEPVVIAPNDFPDFLKWMEGAEDILIFDKEKTKSTALIQNATLIFTLDFNHLSRTGDMESHLAESKAEFAMIDHHRQPDSYARLTYSEVGMSSTCEMVYHFIKALGKENEITPNMADCLYAGIMTDTGSFKFASTTSTTHRVAAALIDKGAAHTAIHQKIMDSNSPDRIRLLARALGNMVMLEEYNTAYITLSQEELDQFHFRKGDTEGFVNYGLSLKDFVLAAIFIENKDEGIIKISLRSQGDFSVNDMARAHFDGGGHTNAAGGRSELSLVETVEKFRNLLPQYKKELTS